MQRITGQQRQHGGEVIAERAKDGDHHQRERHVRCTDGVANPGTHLPEDLAARRSEGRRRNPRERRSNKPTSTGRKEAALTRNAWPIPTALISDAGDRRADHARRIEEHAIEGDGILQLVTADQFGHEGLAGGIIEGIDGAQHKRQQ